MNRDEAVAGLTFRVGGSTRFWQADEKVYAVNEALSVWQAMTGARSVRISIPSASGTAYYSVPRQVTAPLRVRYNGSWLKPTSLYELDTFSPGWEAAASGTPTHWVPVGLGLILLYPTPSTTALPIEIVGIGDAGHCPGNTATLPVSDGVLTVLLGYGHHYLSFKEGTSEAEATSPLYTALMQAAAQEGQRGIAKAFMKGQTALPKDESQKPQRAGEPKVGAR